MNTPYRNFITDTHTAQKLEMIALARETVRSKMPVNHWVFSWPEGEQPTRVQVDELVDIFLEKMGLKDHQAIYGLHCDTRNYPVHIAVNRVHPETLKVVRSNNGFDIREAHKIKAFVEKKQGWSELANAPFVYTEDGELAERKLLDSSVRPSPKARDFERATGEKSAQRIAQERGHGLIKNAQSWAELHTGLKQVGLRFEKKGSAAIIWSESKRSRHLRLIVSSSWENFVKVWASLWQEITRTYPQAPRLSRSIRHGGPRGDVQKRRKDRESSQE